MVRVRFPRSVYTTVNITWFTNAVITNLVSAGSPGAGQRMAVKVLADEDYRERHRQFPIHGWGLVDEQSPRDFARKQHFLRHRKSIPIQLL